MEDIPFVFGITINACSLLFFILLVVVYFRKNAKYSIKNHIFRRILYMGIAGFLFEFIYLILLHFTGTLLLIGFAHKTMLLCFVACVLMWTYYVFILIFEKNQNVFGLLRRNRTRIDIYLIIIFGVISIIELFLPSTFYYNNINVIQYVGGYHSIFAFVVILFLMILPLPFLLLNLKNITIKKFYPYFIIGIIFIVTSVILILFPSYTMIGLSFTLSCYLIYDRLENPDIVLVRKLIHNTEQMKTFRKKYGFLFNMSPELRELLNEISYMKDNVLVDEKRPISKKRLETLILDFVKSSEYGFTTQTILDDDGVEILAIEDPDDDLMLTREIYSLEELKSILEEDNAPKW